MLEKIRDIETAIENGALYSALALSLTIPDICSKVAYPEMVKKSDQGKRFEKWFNEYVCKYFCFNNDPNENIFNGFACYLLRCSFLHSGNFDLLKQNNNIRIKGVHLRCDDTCIKQGFYFQRKEVNNDIFIDVNVELFCKAICEAGKEFYNSIEDKTLFNDSFII